MSSEFVWTDTLVEEYRYYRPEESFSKGTPMQQFKKSKQSKLDYEILQRFDYNEGCYDGDIAPIKSVRRLSDNEVFTIGDEVFENVTGDKGSWFIKEFYLKDTRCFSCGINIDNMRKHKEYPPPNNDLLREQLIEVKLTKSELNKLMQLING
jgi:hypothetical protein